MWSLIAFEFFLLSSVAAFAGRFVPSSRAVTLPIRLELPGSVFPNNTASNDTISRSGLTEVTMSSDQQSYYAVIKVGEAYFRVALDTASSDLWITSSACETTDCKAVPRYPLAFQSPSYVAVNGNNTAFNVRYADTTAASGFVAMESVEIANLTVENQAFGLVTESNVTMIDQTSGIFGLGFTRLSSIANSVTNSTPFLVSLAQQGILDYPLFGLSLTRNASGTLSIGAVDSSIVTNTTIIDWNKVVEFAPFGTESNTSSYLQWAIYLSSISVNGSQLIPQPTYPNITSNSSIALFDIGTDGLYGPYQDVSRIFALFEDARLVDPNGQWAVPCDTIVPMTFTFGERNYTLQPTDYLIGPAAGNPNLCLSWPRALPPSSDGIDWQIGTAFLRTVYSIFSYGINTKESPMIGLYPLRNTTNSTETPGSIASFFSSISATVATTLPNVLVPTPTFTTPPYALNSSISASAGGIVSFGLATSTYVPILAEKTPNATAVPIISPQPSVVTVTLTDSAGKVETSTYTYDLAQVTLGRPPGWNAGTSLRVPIFASSIACLVFLLFITDNLL